MYLITTGPQRPPCIGYFTNKTILRRFGCNDDPAENTPRLKYFNDCLCNFLSGNIQYSKYYLYAYTFKIAHTRALPRELAKYDAAGTGAFLRIMSENSS